MERSLKLYQNGDVDAIRDEINKAAEIGRTDSTASARRTFTQEADAMANAGAPLATQFPTLDRALGGGLWAGMLVGIAGPPGSAKTMVAGQLARAWAERGCPVAFVAADESPRRLMRRIGQGMGIDRDLLRRGDGAALAQLRELDAKLPALSIYDGGAHAAVAERAVDDLLREVTPTGHRVLIIDSLQSLQKVHSAGEASSEDRRAQIDDLVDTLKQAARRGLIVVVTSEVNRRSFSSRNAAERSDPISSFKESSGIEFGLDLGIFLSSPKGMNGTFDAEVVKNREGEKPTFRLGLHFPTATLMEVFVDDEQEEKPDPSAEESRAILR